MRGGLLNQLSPAALSAAMRGGTEGWGQGGSVRDVRYAEPVLPSARRRCRCGCKKRATFRGMANGVCLVTGCEFDMRYWVKHGYTRQQHQRWIEHRAKYPELYAPVAPKPASP
jgi:hypothetical protein